MDFFRETFFATHDSYILLVLRILLGLVIFPHGAQKLVGWFGGPGFSGSMQYFTQVVHLPWLIGFLVILIEFFGSLFLLVGFATRLAAIGMIALALGATFTVCLPHGFFMNWVGNQKGEGFEFHLLVIGMAIALLIGGGGIHSLDRMLVCN